MTIDGIDIRTAHDAELLLDVRGTIDHETRKPPGLTAEERGELLEWARTRKAEYRILTKKATGQVYDRAATEERRLIGVIARAVNIR